MACSLALIMEVMRMQKKMVEEGKKRLNILLEMGLWDEVTKAFEKNGTTCLSEAKILFGVCGINFTFDEMLEFKAIKEKFEKDYDCLVYYGVLTTTIMGQFLSLLFVSRYEEEWEDDRRELKEGYPYAYVWNREEEFGEIGCIQIKMEQGGLVRVA